MIVGEEFVVEMKGANTRIMLTALGSVEFDAVASLLEGWRGKGGRGVKKIKKIKKTEEMIIKQKMIPTTVESGGLCV